MLSYEYFHDERGADRGIPSQFGRPYRTDPSTFFGNPAQSFAKVDAHIATAVFEHETDFGLKIRSQARFADYDKFYQNIYPGGPVNAAGTSVNLTAYNNTTPRQNLFDQTDFIYKLDTGILQHTLLAGFEVGRQSGVAFRQDGFFSNRTSALAVSPLWPVSLVPVTFRNNTGANNDRQKRRAPRRQASPGSGPPAPEPVAASDDVAETAASEPPSEVAPPPAPDPSTAEAMEAPEVPPPSPLKTVVTLPRAEKKPEQKKREKTPPPPAALASSAAAPTAAAGGGRPSAARIATWKSELALRLATRKRYPAEAQVRQQQGVALLRFAVDGTGRVVSRALVKSSGVASLDEETLTLVNRAGPFPPPPPGMPIPVEISVPVRFSIK